MSKLIPPEGQAALMRLEARQVMRGFKSEFFPQMTLEQAKQIRACSLEELTAAVTAAEQEES